MAGIRIATIAYHHASLQNDKDGKTIGQLIDAELSTRVNSGELVQEVSVQFDMMDSHDVTMLREMYDFPNVVKPKRKLD